MTTPSLLPSTEPSPAPAPPDAAPVPKIRLGPGTVTERDPRFGRDQVRVEDLWLAARAYIVLAARLAARARSETWGWPLVLTHPDHFVSMAG